MPIKRHPALQPLSREHHHTLLLRWKIKTGIAKNIEVERIKKYCNWFFQNHLLPHFDAEENELVKITGTENTLFKQMMAEHAHIKKLFGGNDSKEALETTAKALEAHVRFEERILFNEIQEMATDAQLQAFAAAHHEEKFVENTEDEFWTKQ